MIQNDLDEIIDKKQSYQTQREMERICDYQICNGQGKL